jgi:hypothetical protein
MLTATWWRLVWWWCWCWWRHDGHYSSVSKGHSFIVFLKHLVSVGFGTHQRALPCSQEKTHGKEIFAVWLAAVLTLPGVALLTDKTRIHLRFASIRTYTFFTTGIP